MRVRKLRDEEKERIAEEIIKEVHRHVYSKMRPKDVFGLLVRVDISSSDDAVDVMLDVDMDIFPLCGIRPEDLVSECMEVGFKRAEEVLRMIFNE